MLDRKEIFDLMMEADELRTKAENPNGSREYDYLSTVYHTLEYVLGLSSESPLCDW